MKNLQQNKQGGALLLVMLMMLILMVFSVGMFKLSQNHTVDTVYTEGRARAFWLAEAGLADFRAAVDPWKNRAPLASLGLLGNGVLSGTVSDVGAYTVDVVNYTGGGWSNLGRATKRYWIRATGTSSSGDTETIEIQARVGTFADYIYATHDEGRIQFYTGDVLDGRMHSNDRFKINGTPEFLGQVSTAADYTSYTDGRAGDYVDPNVFTAGLELGAPELDFGQYGDDPIEELQADADLLLTEDTNIEFLGDEYRYRPTSAGSGIPWTTNTINPRDIIYVTAAAFVKGRVGGEISVVAEERVHITDDIVYDSTPNNDYSKWPSNYSPPADELLGLISKETVQIDSPPVNGQDINIHAAIYITEPDSVSYSYPGFRAESWKSSIGTPDINLLGSISQYKRGAVGTTGGGGYKKNYSYDERFIDAPPPGIPYSAYSFSEWRLP